MTKEEFEKLKETVAYFGHWYDVIGEERVSILEKSIEYIADLEKENAELKSELTKKADTNHSLVEQMAKLEEENNKLLDVISNYEVKVADLEKQIEKMKNCGNCKYGQCGGSTMSIDKDGNRTFHNWNEEKQAYCDIGKNGKYQCWEIKEND